MSKDWVADIMAMQDKFGTIDWTLDNKDNPEKLKAFLKFRIDFLEEELAEPKKAFAENDPEEIVDGLIDICVVAIGTLDAFGVDAYKAWDTVLRANNKKEIGVKPSRPNPLGVPDLIKPIGWQAPDHTGNHGSMHDFF